MATGADAVQALVLTSVTHGINPPLRPRDCPPVNCRFALANPKTGALYSRLYGMLCNNNGKLASHIPNNVCLGEEFRAKYGRWSRCMH